MSLSRTLGLAALALGSVALIGCADSDGDGLSNSKEKKYGSDKDLADSDGDGISDGDEVEQGLDPVLADSDGDGYSDGIEIAAGTDPLDSASMIYQGGWSFNPNKDALADPGLTGGARVGDMVPRITGKDQFGDTVDLYDFANQGKPILIDISAQWCPPCQAMADWMDNGDSWRGNAGYLTEFNPVRRAVNNDEVIWITFMAENLQGDDPTAQTVRQWYNDFPHEKIPVLVDRQKSLTAWSGLNSFPTTMWVNEDMTIEAYSTDDPYEGLQALTDSL